MQLAKLVLTSTTALGLSMATAGADDNETTVTQDGTENTALVDQDRGADGSAGGGTNQTATVDQNGNENETDVLQQGDGNATTVSQVGNSNETTVTQQGDSNRADNSSTGARNIVTVDQAPETVVIPTFTGFITFFVGGEGNESDVTVEGDENTVDVNQIRNSNDSDVDIDGSDNDVDVAQDASSLGDGNSSIVAITGLFGFGDDNKVIVDQEGDSTSDVDISGDRNSVDVMQNGGERLDHHDLRFGWCGCR